MFAAPSLRKRAEQGNEKDHMNEIKHYKLIRKLQRK